MRVSDDRYTRDRQRLDLALRLIRHEARTFTIRQWTGLSDDRIRKLYRSYVQGHDARFVARHRGKSPRQAAFFFRNAELNFQSAQLASLYVMYGLLCGTRAGLESRYRVGSLESGALLNQRDTAGVVGPGIGVAGGAPGVNADLEIDPQSGYMLVVLSNYDPPAAEDVAKTIRGWIGLE